MILYALVLAAGTGARYGGGKLTAPWRDGVLIDGALRAAFAAPAAGVVVVTGAGREAVQAAAHAFAERARQAGRLSFVYAPDHAEGMAASLRAGVAALPDEADGVLVFLGDMPLVPAAVAGALARALEQGALAAVPRFEGQHGHPVAFARSLFSDLLALQGDRGARALLTSLGDRLATEPADDPGVLLDVDRPDDLPA